MLVECGAYKPHAYCDGHKKCRDLDRKACLWVPPPSEDANFLGTCFAIGVRVQVLDPLCRMEENPASLQMLVRFTLLWLKNLILLDVREESQETHTTGMKPSSDMCHIAFIWDIRVSWVDTKPLFYDWPLNPALVLNGEFSMELVELISYLVDFLLPCAVGILF